MTDLAAKVSRIVARQILDSRGRPTVEVDVTVQGGSTGRASAPAGASMGKYEARELRDGIVGTYEGMGVQSAVRNVTGEIADRLIGVDALDQLAVDNALTALDATPTLERLGANAILSTSLAVCRAAAAHSHQPLHAYIAGMCSGRQMSLPMPMVNILSGGAHAGRQMDFQDFLIIPIGAASYPAALEMICRVRNSAAKLVQSMGLPAQLADEGGLSPGFDTVRAALDLMTKSIEAAGFRPGADMAIALDVAASELLDGGMYNLKRENRHLTGAEMIDFVEQLVRAYPVASIEDALEQDDWIHWANLTDRLGGIQLVGDDLFATNASRIASAVERRVANAALIKLNQNGTLTGTLAAMAAAWRGGYATIVSARSGETEDSFIADLAVATGAGQIKIGSVRNAERLTKYNQLSRIAADSDLPLSPFRLR